MDLRSDFNRLSLALDRAGKLQSDVAALFGITDAAVSQWAHKGIPRDRVKRIAEWLKVDESWLRNGDGEPKTLGQGLSIYGNVAKATHAEEDITGTPIHKVDEPRLVTMPGDWVLVQIDGMSAYPVIFPHQFGIFDRGRAARPTFTEEELYDLHDNIVLVELTNGRSLLKRLCRADRHPDGFLLATIDAGRSSPYIPAEDIEVVMPMVGTLYQDPSKPRSKMNHGKNVTPRGVGP